MLLVLAELRPCDADLYLGTGMGQALVQAMVCSYNMSAMLAFCGPWSGEQFEQFRAHAKVCAHVQFTECVCLCFKKQEEFPNLQLEVL